MQFHSPIECFATVREISTGVEYLCFATVGEISSANQIVKQVMAGPYTTANRHSCCRCHRLAAQLIGAWPIKQLLKSLAAFPQQAISSAAVQVPASRITILSTSSIQSCLCKHLIYAAQLAGDPISMTVQHEKSTRFVYIYYLLTK